MICVRIALHALVLSAGLVLPGCDSLNDDDDRDVEPQPDTFHELSEQCGFDGPELPPHVQDSVPAFVRCAFGTDCTLHDTFMSSLRVTIDVDLSGHTVATTSALISRPDGGSEEGAAVTFHPVLLRDRCTHEPRARMELALLRPVVGILELQAGTTELDLADVGAWTLAVDDPETIAIARDGGDELAADLELGVGDSVALESVVHGGDGEALTTLGSELWWSDDEEVLAAHGEADAQAQAGADAGVPEPGPALQARGSRVVVEALAPGETALHVLAANVERVVTVTVQP